MTKGLTTEGSDLSLAAVSAFAGLRIEFRTASRLKYGKI